MEPIFLTDIANNPQSGAYADLIAKAKSSGQEHWQIWHLFAFRPEMTDHLVRFTEGVMRGPSPLSPGLRELIATYTSHLNQCQFCTKCHAAVSSELLGDDDLVQSVLRNLESSPLEEKEKALLRFAAKMTKNLPSTERDDIEILKSAGWTDEAIYYTIMVCALFNFYNRWVTASGVQPVSDAGHRLHGKTLAQKGYDPKRRLTALE